MARDTMLVRLAPMDQGRVLWRLWRVPMIFTEFTKHGGEEKVSVRNDDVSCVHKPTLAWRDGVILEFTSGKTLEVAEGYDTVMRLLGKAVDVRQGAE